MSCLCLRLLDVNSQLKDWSIRVNNCKSISFESLSRVLIEVILFWTRLSIRLWVVSKRKTNKSLNSFCSKERLAVKCESLDRPSLVDLVVLANSLSKACMSEQHICFCVGYFLFLNLSLNLIQAKIYLFIYKHLTHQFDVRRLEELNHIFYHVSWHADWAVSLSGCFYWIQFATLVKHS